MSPLQHWPRLTLAALMCVLVLGCHSGAPGAAGAPGRGGAPAASGGGGARGAPITIPAIVLKVGEDLGQARDEVEDAIKAQCGGKLCVSVVTDPATTDGMCVKTSIPSFQQDANNNITIPPQVTQITLVGDKQSCPPSTSPSTPTGTSSP